MGGDEEFFEKKYSRQISAMTSFRFNPEQPNQSA
jgi:hypothetical protein